MPLILDRNQVLAAYAEAGARGWVVPTFCTENLTTTEAVLAAVKEFGDQIGRPDIPVSIAVTNLYSHRSQTANYTHTRCWDIGMKLFLADMDVLTSPGSPFEDLKVMIHLDHIQPDLDRELLGWNMGLFSSIMFDASTLPFEENRQATAAFMKAHGDEIVVEGACDEIIDATGCEVNCLTTPEKAEEYVERTGVDFVVANLGTEHRASAAELVYRGDLARLIRERIGPKIVLHGCSSVSNEQVRNLYTDGVAKVNIWTALERDSTPALFEDMVVHASKVAGSRVAERLAGAGYLGRAADISSRPHLNFFTTVYRQGIVFEQMKKIADSYLRLWYVGER